MKKIKLLTENLINQIAAGEVIDRPASVVKELVENSVDAGANRIEIGISNGCRNIRVADNGHGIDKDDVTLAFSRHATSKISEQKDLWSISTMGFRGEALASIISVAKVSCITKTADSETGIKVECENSEITVSGSGCANGTIMEVTDLFYNIPARMKFLKKAQAELAAISEVVQGIALANPGIAFNLINNKNSILKTTGSNDLATTIGEIYSKNIINEFSEVHKEDPQFGLRITGFAGNPDFVRSNKKAIFTFINGRIIKCPILLKSIDTAYSDMVPSGKHPYLFLNISIPGKNLDINVHPAKKEVKYTNPNLIFNFVYSAIKSALDVTGSSKLQFTEDKQEEITYQATEAPSFTTSAVVDFAAFSGQVAVKTEEPYEIDEEDIREVNIKQPRQNCLELDNLEENSVEKPEIIGQLSNTYILIQTPDGLQIVDQHIAHERFLYEKLKDEKTSASQMLLISEPITLEAEQVSLVKENSALLARYGYEFEFANLNDSSASINAGDLTLKFKRVPSIVAQKDPGKILQDILDALSSSPDTIEDELLIRTACRASVKAGERLSLRQMEELIINWKKTRYPRTCPHGRKVAHTVPEKEIAGFFGRI